MPDTLNDVKYAALVAQTGLVGHTLNDNEWAWLYSLCGTDPYPPSADPTIIWHGDEFTSIDEDTSYAYPNLYFYENDNGTLPPPYDSTAGYYYPDGVVAWQRVIDASASPFTDGEYLVKYEVYEVVEGNAVNITLRDQPGREGQWWDLFRCNIACIQDGVGRQEIVIEVSVGAYQSGDSFAGTGVIVPGSQATRRVRFISEVPAP